MKNIFLFVFMLAVAVSAQSLTTQNAGVTGGKKHYIYKAGMADSTASFYSPVMTVENFYNETSADFRLTGLLKTYSAAAACSVLTLVEGRYINGSTASDWVTVDTLGASGTETSQIFAADLNGYKPDQIRIHFDGLTGNRADAVLSVFMTLIPKTTFTNVPIK